MPEKPTITVNANTDGFVRALQHYGKALRLGASAAFEEGARAFLRRVLRFTPPPTKRTGTKAVRRDILRAIAPLRESQFDDKGIRKAIKSGRIDLLQRLFERLPEGSPLAGYRVVRFSPAYHAEARDARGRVRRRQRVLTPDVRDLMDYIKRIQERVGWAKGAWAPSARALQVPVLPWAAQHEKRAGEFFSNLHQAFAISPRLVMTAHSNYAAGEETRIVRNALDEATKALMESAIRRQRADMARVELETQRAEMRRVQ